MDALLACENLFEAVAEVVSAKLARDCVAYFKGFHAIQAQRCAHAYWRRGGFENDHVSFALQDRVNELFAVDAHPGATIGGGCFMDHATNVAVVSVDVPPGATVVETNRFLYPSDHHVLKERDPGLWQYDPTLHAQGDRPTRSDCKWPYDDDAPPKPSLPEGI
ncbi:serine O-acetyltransferase [Aureococcus anophagefferens]|nr:serine O-acetyltransferase [Aureococcus anophagefferens]